MPTLSKQVKKKNDFFNVYVVYVCMYICKQIVEQILWLILNINYADGTNIMPGVQQNEANELLLAHLYKQNTK